MEKKRDLPSRSSPLKTLGRKAKYTDANGQAESNSRQEYERSYDKGMAGTVIFFLVLLILAAAGVRGAISNYGPDGRKDIKPPVHIK